MIDVWKNDETVGVLQKICQKEGILSSAGQNQYFLYQESVSAL